VSVEKLKQSLVQRAATALEGTYCEIKSFTLPRESETGKPLEFQGEAHLFGTPAWPNFAIAFWYKSGPMAKITVTVDGQPFDLTPGSGVAVYATPRPDPCYSLKRGYAMTLTEEGTYGFMFLAGYIDLEKGVFYYDDKVERTVNVTVPTPPWPWWLIAATAGGIALIGVASVIMYQEVERWVRVRAR